VVHELEVDRRAVRQQHALDPQIDHPSLVDLAPHPAPHIRCTPGKKGPPYADGCDGADDRTTTVAMPRRHTIALTPAEQREYLETSHTCILTTLDRHGYPHAVAMWFVVEPDGAVSMTTFGKSQKTVNVRRDPRCAVLVESGRTYDELKGLLIRGRATVIEDTDQVLDLLGRVHEKYNHGHAAEVRDALLAQARKRVIVRIHPERVSSWDHRKLAGAY
jgi:PPOX class probable F420-dependent enzyme